MNTINCLLVGTLLLLCLGLSGCQAERTASVPEQLHGVWTTGAPGYADTFLEFTGETVVFGSGLYAANSYLVVNLEEVREEKGSLYTVSYKDIDSEEYQLSFYYDPTNRGVIRFKNQDHLTWAREEG
ncbi:MAG: hypothetical protein ACE5NA_04505 [Nitrospiraceae bacterium]